MKPSRAVIAAASVVLLTLGACDGQPTVGPGGLPATTTGLPTDLPEVPPASYAEGTAQIEVTGDLTIALDLPLIPQGSVYHPQSSNVTYADSAGNTFAMGGTLQTGLTSAAFILTLTVVEPQPASFVSADGECTVTFDEASEEGLVGSLACEDLQTGGEGPAVNVTGTFEASA